MDFTTHHFFTTNLVAVVRQAFRFSDEGMVAHHLERRFESLEKACPVVQDTRRLSMHDPARPYDTTTVRLHDRLVSETHAQDGYSGAPTPDEWYRDAGFSRCARAR